MRFFSLTMATGASILLVCSVTLSVECSPGYALLSPDQRVAIANAKLTHAVELMEGVVNGERRVLVILGEVHVQDGPTKKNAREMVEAFPQRGVEGYPGSLLWKGARNLAYLVEGVFTGRMGGSTIPYAKAHEVLAKRAKKLSDRLGLEHQSKDALKENRYRVQGKVMSGADVLRLAKMADTIRTIQLEEGYAPTLGDRANAWALPVVYTADRLWFLPGVAGIPSLTQLDLPTAGALFGASLGTFATTTTMKMLWSDGFAPAMGKRREARMRDNIMDHFQDSADNQALLIVVGRSHLYGVREGLKNDHGFEWVDFPRPE